MLTDTKYLKRIETELEPWESREKAAEKLHKMCKDADKDSDEESRAALWQIYEFLSGKAIK